LGFYLTRLSLINAKGKEQLLLRNPADTKAGFWLTYLVDDVPYKIGSVEKDSIVIASKEESQGSAKIVLDFSQEAGASPVVRLEIEVWSQNKPFMLIRHKVTNLSDKVIDDLRLYNLMDFDVGGPSSYKDDIGVFDEDSGMISVCDDNPLCVVMASKPKPDAWEIESPMKLKVTVEYRDLKKNLELGPKDVATGLQWNQGMLEPSESKTVDIVLASAPNLEEAKDLVNNSWGLFKKKIQ
jgi:hypothetical protein